MKDSPHPHSPLEFGLTKINSDLYPQKKRKKKWESTERRIRKGVNIDYLDLEKKNQELVNRCPRIIYFFVCLFHIHPWKDFSCLQKGCSIQNKTLTSSTLVLLLLKINSGTLRKKYIPNYIFKVLVISLWIKKNLMMNHFFHTSLWPWDRKMKK